MVLSPGKKIAITNEEKEAQRQRIIRAAVAVFGKYGFYKSTISQIAIAAGMGRGTLYWYFESKEELFHAMTKQFCESAIDQVKKELGAEDHFEDILRRLIRSWLDSAVKQKELFHIMYSIYGQMQGEFAQSMQGAMRDMYQAIMAILENLLNQAIIKKQMREADTHRLARLLIGLVDGIVLQHIFVEPFMPEAMTEVVMSLLFKGLQRTG
ncbi:TetR family transcriptional regulator [candidate division FCPU426 bacterium]|nr:TetR family transcriptional regulator [candidate division FCPU426 bacterium]